MYDKGAHDQVNVNRTTKAKNAFAMDPCTEQISWYSKIIIIWYKFKIFQKRQTLHILLIYLIFNEACFSQSRSFDVTMNNSHQKNAYEWQGNNRNEESHLDFCFPSDHAPRIISHLQKVNVDIRTQTCTKSSDMITRFSFYPENLNAFYSYHSIYNCFT